MEQSVGGHGAATVRTRLTLQRGERASGLADQDVEGREVPQVHLWLGGDIDSSFGHKAVGPKVAVPAQAPRGVCQVDELLPDAPVGPPAE